jgi:predicted transglutaminase-like cysteine proteinase
MHCFGFPFVTPLYTTSKLNYVEGVQSRMTNKITYSLLTLAVAGLMIAGSASAQTQNTAGAGPDQVDPGHPRVNQVNGRETNQQNRIANGVKNGQLTPGQTAHLERGEQRLQNNEKRDMAKDNGHLTKQDQRQLNREANHMSKRIAADKHSAK